MAVLFTLEPVVLLPHSVYVGHGYLQYAGAKYSGHVNVRNHSYSAPEDLVLPDSISFPYQWSLKIQQRRPRGWSCTGSTSLHFRCGTSRQTALHILIRIMPMYINSGRYTLCSKIKKYRRDSTFAFPITVSPTVLPSTSYGITYPRINYSSYGGDVDIL